MPSEKDLDKAASLIETAADAGIIERPMPKAPVVAKEIEKPIQEQQATRPNRFCTDCIYCQKSGHARILDPTVREPSDAWLCTAKAERRNLVTGFGEGGLLVKCVIARKGPQHEKDPGGQCGPEGRLYRRA
jgi:hypothetical protein